CFREPPPILSEHRLPRREALYRGCWPSGHLPVAVCWRPVLEPWLSEAKSGFAARRRVDRDLPFRQVELSQVPAWLPPVVVALAIGAVFRNRAGPVARLLHPLLLSQVRTLPALPRPCNDRQQEL